jgi:Ca2+-binding EF-hand superfamily protein
VITDKFTSFMNSFWDTYDINKDGALDREEFKNFLADSFKGQNIKEEQKKKLIDTKFDKMFSKFDKDGNGVISRDEMLEFVLGLMGLKEDQIDMEKVMKSIKRKESLKIKKEEARRKSML